MNGEQATLFRREALAQETDTWRAVLRTHPEIASFIDGISAAANLPGQCATH